MTQINITDSSSGALKVIPVNLIKRVVAPDSGGIQLELTTKRLKITDTTLNITDIAAQMTGYGIIVTNTQSELTEQREVYSVYNVKEIIQYEAGSKLTLESYQLDVICSEDIATIAGQNVVGLLAVTGTRNIQKGSFQPKDHLIPDHRVEMITNNEDGFAEVYFREGLYPITMEVSTEDFLNPPPPPPASEMRVESNGNQITSGQVYNITQQENGGAPVPIGFNYQAVIDFLDIGADPLNTSSVTQAGDFSFPVFYPGNTPPTVGDFIAVFAFDTSTAGTKTISVEAVSDDPASPFTFDLIIEVA